MLRHAVVLLIRVYQVALSPLLPRACIYVPTCSQYAREAILSHGVLRGVAAAAARILRCAGGLFEGGEDPVPERITFGALAHGYRRFLRRKTPRRR
jgi:putative membrane protein insertion efficiency factor